MRGFIGGLAIGLVTVVLGVVALTLIWPAPQPPQVADTAPVAATGAAQTGEDGDQPVDLGATGAEADVVQVMPSELKDPNGEGDGQSGGQDTTAVLDGADTSPADKPDVTVATPGLDEPGTGTTTADVRSEGDTPVATATSTVELSTPDVEGQPSVAVNPTQPVVSQGAPIGDGFGTGTTTQDTAPDIASSGESAPLAPAVPAAPAGVVAATLSAPIKPVENAPTPQVQSTAAANFGSTATAQDSAPVVSTPQDVSPSVRTSAALAAATPGVEQPPVLPSQVPTPATPDSTAPTMGSGEGLEEDVPEIVNRVDTAPTTPVAGAGPVAPGQDQSPDIALQSSQQPDVQSTQVARLAPAPEVSQTAPISPIAPTGSQIAATPSVLPAPSGGDSSVPEVDQSARAVPESQVDPEPSDTEVASLPQAGSDEGGLRPTIGKRVVPLTERNAARAAGIQVTSDVKPSEGFTPNPEIARPLQANSEKFENPEGRPLMAIVLIDSESSLGVEALAEFPYPVSFAVDPSDPNAAAKMARHRAAGFEVVLIADLPRLATAQDAETSLSVWLNELPDAVALLEGTATGIQGSRDLAEQVTSIAGQTGLGLIMQARGLNTAFKLAARDGVPAALVFRDFDGAGQTPVIMRRFLDQAAFRAGQQGGVIMLGRLRPDTISALLIWGLQDRVSRVAVAPVSAILTQER